MGKITNKVYTAWNKGLKGYTHSGSFKKGHKSYTKSGKENAAWKGDEVGYRALHNWLKKEYGKATKCENPDCPKKYHNYNWSLLKGKKYQRKRENFWMLCRSCHMRYDNVAKKAWKTRRKNGEDFCL